MSTAILLNDPRWTSLFNRDVEADGTFVYSVKTTGVYCRPSCASRLPKPENVRFHSNPEQAERAGFRPCKRCKPNQLSIRQQHAQAMADACRLLDLCEEQPRLKDLAASAGISTYHFHRLFVSITGVTPKEYAAAARVRRVRATLTKGGTITDAIYEAGYNSNSQFYTTSGEALGMTPATFRAGGRGAQIRFAVGQCSLGSLLVAQSERGVCAILIGDDPNQLIRDVETRFPNAGIVAGGAEFNELVAKVVGLVEAPNIGIDLPLDIRGTAFQQRVWQALRNIPVGSTATYTDIANQLGVPKSVRAVAQACAANALAVAIPCHRVVRMDGDLAGYRWGVERKRALLEREAN